MTFSSAPSTRSLPHREFFDLQPWLASADWQTVPSRSGLIEELTLRDSFDAERRTGSRTLLARWSAGAWLDRAVVHDFCEEVYLLQGDLVVGCDAQGQGGDPFSAPTYACRPPGAVHGPFLSRGGCLMLEIQYHEVAP